MGDQGVRQYRHARPGDNKHDRHFAKVLMRCAHHGTIQDGSKRANSLLDFRGCNVLTTTDHQLLESACNGQEPIEIAARKVAGVIPAVTQGGRSLRRFAMVSLHHVGTPHNKLALLTRLDIPTYAADKLPPELAAIPAIKPGSRGLK